METKEFKSHLEKWGEAFESFTYTFTINCDKDNIQFHCITFWFPIDFQFPKKKSEIIELMESIIIPLAPKEIKDIIPHYREIVCNNEKLGLDFEFDVNDFES